VQVRLTAEGARLQLLPDASVLSWPLTVQPGERREVHLRIDIDDRQPLVVAAPFTPTWTPPAVTADDRRFEAWLWRSMEDLGGLRLAMADQPDDVFLAAGVPWFLTLFGRDSLWAARMLLPLGT